MIEVSPNTVRLKKTRGRHVGLSLVFVVTRFSQDLFAKSQILGAGKQPPTSRHRHTQTATFNHVNNTRWWHRLRPSPNDNMRWWRRRKSSLRTAPTMCPRRLSRHSLSPRNSQGSCCRVGRKAGHRAVLDGRARRPPQTTPLLAPGTFLRRLACLCATAQSITSSTSRKSIRYGW